MKIVDTMKSLPVTEFVHMVPYIYIVGAVLAFTLVWGGASSVIWAEPIKAFPYFKGVLPVVVSWFVAPMASLIVAASTFLINRYEYPSQLLLLTRN